jgi:hypothetical protein
MPSTIPQNSLQEARRKAEQYKKRPDITGRNQAAVVILKVYDPDVLGGEGVPSGLVPYVSKRPGTLFAKVRILRSGKELFVGFRDSEATLLSSFGNSVLLEGLRGTILYNGLRPEDGQLIVTGHPTSRLRGLASETSTFDISGIF